LQLVPTTKKISEAPVRLFPLVTGLIRHMFQQCSVVLLDTRSDSQLQDHVLHSRWNKLHAPNKL